MAASAWFNVRHPRPEALIRLVCLPWSGGGSQWYANWGRHAPQHVEVVGVTYPGREARFRDPPCTSLQHLVTAVTAEIQRCLSDKPIALFGHSMGVVVSFEIGRRLTETPGMDLRHIFFSSHFSPNSEMRKKQTESAGAQDKWYELSDKLLIDRVRQLGGVPDKILADEDFMKSIFLPPFRVDLKLCHGYWYDPGPGCPPLACPVTLLQGQSERDFNMEEYQRVTTGVTEKKTFPGGHFYLTTLDTSQALMDSVAERLNQSLDLHQP